MVSTRGTSKLAQPYQALQTLINLSGHKPSVSLTIWAFGGFQRQVDSQYAMEALHIKQKSHLHPRSKGYQMVAVACGESPNLHQILGITHK